MFKYVNKENQINPVDKDGGFKHFINYSIAYIKNKHNSDPAFVQSACQFIENPLNRPNNWLTSLTWDNAKILIETTERSRSSISYRDLNGIEHSLTTILRSLYNAYREEIRYNPLTAAISHDFDAFAIYLLLIGAPSMEKPPQIINYISKYKTPSPLAAALAKHTAQGNIISDILCDTSGLTYDSLLNELKNTLKFFILKKDILAANYICSKYPEIIKTFHGWNLVAFHRLTDNIIINFLNKYHFDINRVIDPTSIGNTVLHYAFRAGPKMVSLFLNNGANPNLKNATAYTPFELANVHSIRLDAAECFAFLDIISNRCDQNTQAINLTPRLARRWIKIILDVHQSIELKFNFSLYRFITTIKPVIDHNSLESLNDINTNHTSEQAANNHLRLIGWLMGANPLLEYRHDLTEHQSILLNNGKNDFNDVFHTSPTRIKTFLNKLRYASLLLLNKTQSQKKRVTISLVMLTLLNNEILTLPALTKLISLFLQKNARQILILKHNLIANFLYVARDIMNKDNRLYQALHRHETDHQNIKTTYEKLLGDKLYPLALASGRMDMTASQITAVTPHTSSDTTITLQHYPNIFIPTVEIATITHRSSNI